ncbi:unnamed protein product [Lampetra planeri]
MNKDPAGELIESRSEEEFGLQPALGDRARESPAAAEFQLVEEEEAAERASDSPSILRWEARCNPWEEAGSPGGAASRGGIAWRQTCRVRLMAKCCCCLQCLFLCSAIILPEGQGGVARPSVQQEMITEH